MATREQIGLLKKAHDAVWAAMRELGEDLDAYPLWDASQTIADRLARAEDERALRQRELLREALNRAEKGKPCDLDLCTACTYGQIWTCADGYVNCGYCGGLGLVK